MWKLRFSMTLACFLCAGAYAGGELPSFYQSPGIAENRKGVSHNADERIDPFSGMLQVHHTDVVVPGNGGFDLAIRRSYNSPTASYGTISDTTSYNRTPNIGVGWNLLIGGRVFNGAGTGSACSGGTQMSFETPDGGRQGLIAKGDGTFISTSRWKAVCVTGGVQVWAPNGTRYDMLKPISQIIPLTIQAVTYLYPTRIEDRNGNYATFSYTTLGSVVVLDTITTSDGRTLRFNYLLYGAVYLLTSLDTGNGLWTYQYHPTPALVDGGGNGVAWFLSQVNPPTGTGAPWKYTYNACVTGAAASCAMLKMTYPEGGYINYFYAFVNFNDGSGNTPVIANKNSGGWYGLSGSSNNWSYAYTPGNADANDQTVVTSPLGTISYEHAGTSTVSIGNIWKVGLLMKRTQTDAIAGVVQVETFAWDKQQIAPYPTRRYFGLDDGVTYAPLTTQRKVTRNGADFVTDFSNFDAYGNAQQIVEAGPVRLRTTTRGYLIDPVRWIVNFPKDEFISDLGNVVRAYDVKGNLTNETRFGVSSSSSYHPDGSVSSRTDANGKITNFSVYQRGIAQLEQRPQGVTINRVVDNTGNITSESDGAGNTYAYSYDAIRRLTAKTPPIGAPTAIAWAGSTRRTATRGVYVETTDFSGSGVPEFHTRGSVETAFAHDAFSNKTHESYPGEVVHNPDGTIAMVGTRLDRDVMSRVKRATHGDAAFRTYAHGATTVQETDENSRQTTYHYQAFGDPDKRFLTAINLPLGNNIAIGRDGLGNITSVTQGTVTRTYGYNGSFFLTSINDPETGLTTFGRDAVGNMTSRTVGGRTTLFGYDGLNRLTSVTYPDANTVVIAYLGNGRTASVTTPQATRTYTYDANANLKTETLVVGGQTFTTTYVYNANDALVSIAQPVNGELITYNPDSFGRPTTAGSYVTAITYLKSGNYSEIKLGNGYSMQQSETTRQWPLSIIAVQTGTSNGYMGKDYTYDGAGNVTGINDQFDPRQSLLMTYDLNNQLQDVQGPWGVASSRYDNVGNITQFGYNGFPTSYSYTANRLTNYGTQNFTYDGYGNVTNDARHAFQYDDASNMTCVNCGTASPITYIYDGNNRRVSRTQSGVTTHYIHIANGDLVTEYTPSTLKGIHHIYVNGKRVASKRFAN